MDMKKFSLKPLGDSCMKMSCKSWFFIGLLMTFCLAACSDDDDDAVAPIFPEKQNIANNVLLFRKYRKSRTLFAMQVRQKSLLLRLIRIGVWHLPPFGVSFSPMIWKNLLCPEQPVHKL